MSRPLSPLPSVLLAAGALAFAGCQWLIHAYAPLEAQLGLMQKIFYVHLPLAWWALISFFVVFAGSVAVLVRGSQSADRLCRAAAEVGVLLSGLTLVTGMIWARRSWGVWWTWDPRLTTALIRWFVYTGYLVLRGLDLPPRRKSPAPCPAGQGRRRAAPVKRQGSAAVKARRGSWNDLSPAAA